MTTKENSTNDKLDFEENEYSNLINDIKRIEPLILSEDFNKVFYRELSKINPEITLAQKIKSVFYIEKKYSKFIPHIQRYRLITGLSMSIAASFLMFIIFNIYSKESSLNKSELAVKSNTGNQMPANSYQQPVTRSQQPAAISMQSAKIKSEKKIKEYKNTDEALIKENLAESYDTQNTLSEDLISKDFNRVEFTTNPEILNNEMTRGEEDENINYQALKSSEGDKYTGELKDGIFNGKGILTIMNGDKYEGTFKNGAYCGYGIYTWQDGTKYEGEWLNGNRDGQGVMYFNNGNKYKGEWSHNLFNGKGSYILNDSSRFAGKWVKDGLKGYGSLVKSNGEKYYGEWNDGKANGKGTYTWSDGSKYIGEWCLGTIQGHGKFIKPDGKAFSGEWKNNRLIQTK